MSGSAMKKLVVILMLLALPGCAILRGGKGKGPIGGGNCNQREPNCKAPGRI